MLNNLKIPIFSTLVIMVLFIFQSYEIINLSAKDEYSKNMFELLEYEGKIRHSLENNQTIPSSLIYKYGIYTYKEKKVVSNLEVTPSTFQFVTLQEKGYLFYKSYFQLEQNFYYLILAKKQNSARILFVTVLTLVFALIVVFVTLYLSFVSGIKPYKDAKKYMNNFFNDAMHELKTPLGVIGINLEMLGIDNKYTNRIKAALKQMQITYEDTEYYIKHSYILFPPEILNLSEFCLERASYMRGLAMSKNIKIYDFVEPDLKVFMNKIEAGRLIDNNLSNAIKYSPAGSIINLKLSLQSDWIVLEVEDFGEGIKDSNKIWKRYVRDEGVQGGFGLGLNIVAGICIKNGIEYSVTSELKKGSVFKYKFIPYSKHILD
ncbi:sensor histidine kinase [Campylobacter sp. RM16187]|uniref:sensor histidine kinase n=1 Tax=Campylobacter sp. RM16187 TaxID=1660063 RepID=UPI0021B61D47|nr:HAMP domain-containing sensor histidine kinase [Campylobacter sp. RM16187]QKG29674.1 two-component system sensor histidine kinase [Campylobacter sp. RM16187]